MSDSELIISPNVSNNSSPVINSDNELEVNINVIEFNNEYQFTVDREGFDYIKLAMTKLAKSREQNRKYYRKRREQMGAKKGDVKNLKKVYNLVVD